jgi:hypothetical protein
MPAWLALHTRSILSLSIADREAGLWGSGSSGTPLGYASLRADLRWDSARLRLAAALAAQRT